MGTAEPHHAIERKSGRLVPLDFSSVDRMVELGEPDGRVLVNTRCLMQTRKPRDGDHARAADDLDFTAMFGRFLWRARNAAARLWSRLGVHSSFGMRRANLDEFHHRLDKANHRVAECAALVVGWTELADRKIVGRELLTAFQADLRAAVGEETNGRSGTKAQAA